MNVERAREICLSLNYAEECSPFGDDNVVFKVGGKMFALLFLNIDHWINLKCDPERAIELREEFSDSIIPAYHMNKKHWNTIFLDTADDSLTEQLIVDSYELVYKSLPRKMLAELTATDI